MYIHSHFETRDVNTLIIIFFKSKKSVIVVVVVVFIGLNTIWLHRSIKRNNNNNNMKKYNSFKHKDKEKIINYLKHIRDVLQMISFL